MPEIRIRGDQSLNRTHLRALIKLILFVALLFAAHSIGNWLLNQLNFQLRPSTEPILHRLIMLSMAIYICLMALPFVPGIEIGLALMALLGVKIVPLVYVATVLALILGFMIGRWIPARIIFEILDSLRLQRLRALLVGLEPLGPQQRLDFLLQHASARFVPFFLRHRFVAIAFALNMPGNAIIGGGGGISFAAGFSRLFSLPQYALTVSVALSPFPIIVLLTGS
jgi:hypothetical protein